MKKTLLLIMLCAVLLTGCSEKNVTPAPVEGSIPVEEETETSSAIEEAYKIYAQKVQELEDEYGVLTLDVYPSGIPGSTWYTANGLSYLSLTDFDRDGVEELVVVCGKHGMRQYVKVYTVKENRLKEIYCNYTGGGGSPVIYQVEISGEFSKHYLLRQTASPTFDVYEMRDGIMKSNGEIEGGHLTFYNDPEEAKDQVEESRAERNSYIFNFPEEYCPEAPDALLSAVNDVKEALSLKTNDSYEILNSPEEESIYYSFLYRGCTMVRDGYDAANYPVTFYDPVFVGEGTKKEYAFDDLDVIKKDYVDLVLADEEELISAAQSSKETFSIIPDKELFTSPYSLEAEDYLYNDITIKDAIAINGDEYEVGHYKDSVIVRYNDIGFVPGSYDPDSLTFDINSTIDQVIIFGDRRVYGAAYGCSTFPELESALRKTTLSPDTAPEKTYNESEGRDEYLFEKDSWRFHYRFIWLDDPETTPCTEVEVMVKEG